jgi:hypothetical protein
MNQYMADSRHTHLDPRTLVLDPAMQARDVELIKDKRLRSAQEVKQASQDKEILEDLYDGQPIRRSITVFLVKDAYYVVDGFHRTGACLMYLKENPEADLKIPALVIHNRTYREAFAVAQDANQGHGVGVTNDESMQSKLRKLIIIGDYSLSVSDVEKVVGCSRGQAAHIARGLKACGEVLPDNSYDADITDLSAFTEQLKEGLEVKWCLTNSAFDSKGFPKIRRLSDAITGKEFDPKDHSESEWEQLKIQEVSDAISRLLGDLGEDFFREGLRKAARGSGLGVTVTLRKKWLEQAGAVEGDSSIVSEHDDGF